MIAENAYSKVADKYVNKIKNLYDQSWKASSGHAFEYMTKELANLALYDTPIKFLLQKDLSTLLKAGELANDPRDIAWLEKQVEVDNFDLFVVAEKDDETYCFGCVQCKTSIRDRVSRDRELSSEAMRAFFWSISLVLDGTQLKTPKYIAMVNGGQTTFRDNGWHGMYDLSNTIPGGRIYTLDMDFAIIKNHALQAYKAWSEQRQWFKTIGLQIKRNTCYNRLRQSAIPAKAWVADFFFNFF